jgi:hypothetical protein
MRSARLRANEASLGRFCHDAATRKPLITKNTATANPPSVSYPKGPGGPRRPVSAWLWSTRTSVAATKRSRSRLFGPLASNERATAIHARTRAGPDAPRGDVTVYGCESGAMRTTVRPRTVPLR